MARPRSTDPTAPLTIRLPASVITALNDKAHADGTEPRALAASLVIAGLRGIAVASHPSARPRPAPVQQTLGCVHKDFHKLSFGGWVCNACGAISRDFGTTWHAATGGG